MDPAELSQHTEEIPRAGEEQPLSVYTLAIDENIAKKLHDYCAGNSEFAEQKLEYTRFAYRSDAGGFSLAVYDSMKLLVTGRGTRNFVQNVFEPKISGKPLLGYDEVWHPEWFEWHAGMDESGKGDVFGPLVTSCVIAGKDAVRKWIAVGVRDSKTIVDKTIFKVEKLIRETPGVIVKTCTADMRKYNDLYNKRFFNMNMLLSYFHFVVLREALVAAKGTEMGLPKWGLLDQFSRNPLVQGDLKNNAINFDLRMQTKAESDPVVAAASIVARATFLRELAALGNKAGIMLPKGCSPEATQCLVKVRKKFGKRRMAEFAKMHFSSVQEALDKA
ncbi:MAG: ribonuclease HIII [Opitutae bacterium]|nr:ribonuclease HIII [Opitutae bacterium]